MSNETMGATRPEVKVFLQTGDDNFSDLFGDRKIVHGIQIPSDRDGSVGASVVITGPAGAGKTILASQLCAQSLRINNRLAAANPELSPLWPSNAQAVIYTLDQRAEDIVSLCLDFDWLCKDEIAYYRKDRHFHDSDGLEAYGRGFRPSDIPERRLFVRPVPEVASVSELVSEIQSDIARADPADPRIMVVVIDSINMAMKAQGGDAYVSELKSLFKTLRKGVLGQASVIITVEESANTPLLEEYVPQCVIRLDRAVDQGKGVDGLMRRTIEIRKARGQAHQIGLHDCTIIKEPSPLLNGYSVIQQQVRGLRVYPSLAARARDLRGSKTATPSNPVVTRFGDPYVDRSFAADHGTRLREGSATLLWGAPGTGKTELGLSFLKAEWAEGMTESSVLLVTSKIDPWVFSRKLLDRARKDALFSDDETDDQIESRILHVDARDPFRTHGSICSEIIDLHHFTESQRRIRRAMIFGLGLLEETPTSRDSQWRFLNVLVALLTSRGITTLLVDWPMEGAADQLASSRPRASKLCSNELQTSVDRNGMTQIKVTRGNYSPVRTMWESDEMSGIGNA